MLFTNLKHENKYKLNNNLVPKIRRQLVSVRMSWWITFSPVIAVRRVEARFRYNSVIISSPEH